MLQTFSADVEFSHYQCYLKIKQLFLKTFYKELRSLIDSLNVKYLKLFQKKKNHNADFEQNNG